MDILTIMSKVNQKVKFVNFKLILNKIIYKAIRKCVIFYWVFMVTLEMTEII